MADRSLRPANCIFLPETEKSLPKGLSGDF